MPYLRFLLGDINSMIYLRSNDISIRLISVLITSRRLDQSLEAKPDNYARHVPIIYNVPSMENINLKRFYDLIFDIAFNTYLRNLLHTIIYKIFFIICFLYYVYYVHETIYFIVI